MLYNSSLKRQRNLEMKPRKKKEMLAIKIINDFPSTQVCTRMIPFSNETRYNDNGNSRFLFCPFLFSSSTEP